MTEFPIYGNFQWWPQTHLLAISNFIVQIQGPSLEVRNFHFLVNSPARISLARKWHHGTACTVIHCDQQWPLLASPSSSKKFTALTPSSSYVKLVVFFSHFLDRCRFCGELLPRPLAYTTRFEVTRGVVLGSSSSSIKINSLRTSLIYQSNFSPRFSLARSHSVARIR